MIKVLKLEVIHSHNTNYTYNREVLSLGDIDTLLKFLDNTVSIKSFKGKVVFLENTTFPRFKLTEYSKKSNKIKRTIKINQADAIVVDVTVLKKELESSKERLHFYKLQSDGKYIESSYNPKAPQSLGHGDVLGNLRRSYYYAGTKNVQDQLEALIEVYNNYPNIPILSLTDLNQEISSGYDAINEEWAKSLESLLASPDANAVKLAMSYMTNANFEDSLFYSLVLLNKHWYKIRTNAYYQSTNFKAFMKNVENAGYNQHSLGCDVSRTIQEFLKLPGKKIMKSSISFIHDQIREEINNTYSFESKGYKLENYEIKLNLKDEDIIDDENIETEEEFVEESNESFDNNTDTYILVDDVK